MKKVLILGSTSHIAKGLIHFFKENSNYILSTCCRKLSCKDSNDNNLIFDCDFYYYKPDVIINCVGKGSPKNISTISFQDINDYNEIDSSIIKYCEIYKDTIYINLSSWVVNKDIKPDHRHYKYFINKKYLEMKHRLLEHLNIIDLRIPAYFSRWIDLDSGFLISNILRKLKYGTDFKISETNDWLYYCTPEFLFKYIDNIISADKIIPNSEIDLEYIIDRLSLKTLLDFFGIKNSLSKNKFELESSLDNIKKEYELWKELNHDI